MWFQASPPLHNGGDFKLTTENLAQSGRGHAAEYMTMNL